MSARLLTRAVPGTLERVVAQRAFRRELILVCGDSSPTASSANGLNTVMQLYALRLHHVLYISDSAAACARLRSALPSLACVWSSRINSSKPKNGGLCAEKYWGFAFYFYDLRKHYAARLAVELRINVLQTDTDVVWLANPYPAFKTAYAGQQLITMSDRPLLNAGVFYTQNVRPGDGAARVETKLRPRKSATPPITCPRNSYDKIKSLPADKAAEIEADLEACYQTRPRLAMVDSRRRWSRSALTNKRSCIRLSARFSDASARPSSALLLLLLPSYSLLLRSSSALRSDEATALAIALVADTS